MRRVVWLAEGMLIGALAGAVGTLWAGRRVRRAVRSVSTSVPTPQAWRAVTGRAPQLAERVRGAFHAAREERARREAELRLPAPGGRTRAGVREGVAPAPVLLASRRRQGAVTPSGTAAGTT